MSPCGSQDDAGSRPSTTWRGRTHVVVAPVVPGFEATVKSEQNVANAQTVSVVNGPGDRRGLDSKRGVARAERAGCPTMRSTSWMHSGIKFTMVTSDHQHDTYNEGRAEPPSRAGGSTPSVVAGTNEARCAEKSTATRQATLEPNDIASVGSGGLKSSNGAPISGDGGHGTTRRRASSRFDVRRVGMTVAERRDRARAPTKTIPTAIDGPPPGWTGIALPRRRWSLPASTRHRPGGRRRARRVAEVPDGPSPMDRDRQFSVATTVDELSQSSPEPDGFQGVPVQARGNRAANAADDAGVSHRHRRPPRSADVTDDGDVSSSGWGPAGPSGSVSGHLTCTVQTRGGAPSGRGVSVGTRDGGRGSAPTSQGRDWETATAGSTTCRRHLSLKGFPRHLLRTPPCSPPQRSAAAASPGRRRPPRGGADDPADGAPTRPRTDRRRPLATTTVAGAATTVAAGGGLSSAGTPRSSRSRPP